MLYIFNWVIQQYLLSVQAWDLNFLFSFFLLTALFPPTTAQSIWQRVLAGESLCFVSWATGPTKGAHESYDLQNGTHHASMVFVHVRSVEVKGWAAETVLEVQSSDKEYQLNDWLQKAVGEKSLVLTFHHPLLGVWFSEKASNLISH